MEMQANKNERKGSIIAQEYKKKKIKELNEMIYQTNKNKNKKGLESYIPDKYKGLTFDDLKAEKDNQEVTNLTIERFNEIEKNPYGLYYYGQVGTGKTAQLSIIAQELQNKKGYKVYYTPESRILSDFKKTFNLKGKSEYDVIDGIIKNHDVICIDEWGEEISSYFKTQMKILIDEIYNNNKILFCSSNYSFSDMIDRYNIETKAKNDATTRAIMDRMRSITTFVWLKGKSLRENK